MCFFIQIIVQMKILAYARGLNFTFSLLFVEISPELTLTAFKMNAVSPKIVAMNAAKAAKHIQQQIANSASTINILSADNARLRKENSMLKQALEEKSGAVEIDSSFEEHANPILKDLLERSASGGEFSSETIEFASTILSMSPQCYKFIKKRIELPSEYICNKYNEECFEKLPHNLQTLEESNEVISNWKDKNNIAGSDKINACLAVDALYFTTDVTIDDNLTISGMKIDDTITESLPKDTCKVFATKPELFEAFLNDHWDSIYKAAFVFQVQPFNEELPNFVIHIKPATSGKANEDIVEILKQLKLIAKNHNINIKTFAFDGDNAYKEMHITYYASYINSVISKGKINLNKRPVMMVVSDFLHLIKRLRYRLLSCIIHGGFSYDGPSIDIDDLQTSLDFIPSVVFRNEPYTKMHDKLPLTLFCPQSFIKLLNESEYTAAAYMFPISACIIAIDKKRISRKARMFFLECAFWFLSFYKLCQENTTEIIQLNQQKRGDNIHVKFYTEDILREFSNTIHTHMRMLANEPKYSFGRDSSIPLEHKFGVARIRAKDVHTMKKFVKTIAEFQSFESECSKMESKENIPGRRSSFGVSVKPDEDSEAIDPNEKYSVTDVSPQEIAKCILHLAGFEIIPDDPKLSAIAWYEEMLNSIIDEPKKKKRSRKTLSSNFVRLGVGKFSRARSFVVSSSKRISPEKKYCFMNDFWMKKYKKHPSLHKLCQIANAMRESGIKLLRFPRGKPHFKAIFDWFCNNYSFYKVVLESLCINGKI